MQVVEQPTMTPHSSQQQRHFHVACSIAGELRRLAPAINTVANGPPNSMPFDHRAPVPAAAGAVPGASYAPGTGLCMQGTSQLGVPGSAMQATWHMQGGQGMGSTHASVAGPPVPHAAPYQPGMPMHLSHGANGPEQQQLASNNRPMGQPQQGPWQGYPPPPVSGIAQGPQQAVPWQPSQRNAGHPNQTAMGIGAADGSMGHPGGHGHSYTSAIGSGDGSGAGGGGGNLPEDYMQPPVNAAGPYNNQMQYNRQHAPMDQGTARTGQASGAGPGQQFGGYAPAQQQQLGGGFAGPGSNNSTGGMGGGAWGCDGAFGWVLTHKPLAALFSFGLFCG